MSDIVFAYREQVADFKARKLPLAKFRTPCCDSMMEVRMPPEVTQYGGRVATPPLQSTRQCPFCAECLSVSVYSNGEVFADVVPHPVLGALA